MLSRLAKLRRLLRQAEIPALLVTKFVNVTYLTGFTGDDSYLLVTPHNAIVLSDFRYIAQLQEECPGFEVEIRAPGDLASGVGGRGGRPGKAESAGCRRRVDVSWAVSADSSSRCPATQLEADRGAGRAIA